MEIALSLPIFIVITVFSINTAFFIFAADFCDRTCKDCARAAGQMSTPDDAVNAMNAAAAAHPVDHFFFKQISPELLVYQDYNYSSSKPTPKYGSTASYTGENGLNNITPDKIAETSVKGWQHYHTADNATIDPLDHENTNVNAKDLLSTQKIEAILADPNQLLIPGPYVVVRTTMVMRIPVCMNFFGARLFTGNVENEPQLFRLASIYTFPITNTYVPI
jgi:hypothetical protein